MEEEDLTKLNSTPRTDSVYKANADLGWGGMVSIPDNHPPCDPWELSRKLEVENNKLKETIRDLWIKYKNSQKKVNL